MLELQGLKANIGETNLRHKDFAFACTLRSYCLPRTDITAAINKDSN